MFGDKQEKRIRARERVQEKKRQEKEKAMQKRIERYQRERPAMEEQLSRRTMKWKTWQLEDHDGPHREIVDLEAAVLDKYHSEMRHWSGVYSHYDEYTVYHWREEHHDVSYDSDRFKRFYDSDRFDPLALGTNIEKLCVLMRLKAYAEMGMSLRTGIRRKGRSYDNKGRYDFSDATTSVLTGLRLVGHPLVVDYTYHLHSLGSKERGRPHHGYFENRCAVYPQTLEAGSGCHPEGFVHADEPFYYPVGQCTCLEGKELGLWVNVPSRWRAAGFDEDEAELAELMKLPPSCF